MAELKRGSQKLLHQRCERMVLEERDLNQFMEMVDFDGIRLVDVFCYGQPRPDLIGGSLQVDREVYDKLANRLLDLKELRAKKWEVFPHGIPVIDHLLVNFEVTRGF